LIRAGININITHFNWSIYFHPTYLIYAILCDLPSIVKVLIEAGVDTSIKDKENNSALSIAQKLGNHEIIQILIDSGSIQ
jgi:ankyrin repeat protein